VVKKTKGEYLNKIKMMKFKCYRWIREVVEEDEGVKQEYTLTPGGENKWLRPVSAVNASSVPRG
jgi:hypothetical protein